MTGKTSPDYGEHDSFRNQGPPQPPFHVGKVKQEADHHQHGNVHQLEMSTTV